MRPPCTCAPYVVLFRVPFIGVSVVSSDGRESFAHTRRGRQLQEGAFLGSVLFGVCAGTWHLSVREIILLKHASALKNTGSGEHQ